MKKYLAIIGCFLAAVAIVLFTPQNKKIEVAEAKEAETSLIKQNVSRVTDTPNEVYKLYNSGQLVGVIENKEKLDAFLNGIYETEYKEEFPDSSVNLGKDLYLGKELSYVDYENKDEEIFDYLKDNNLFTIRSYMISFADENGVYDEIFVKSEEMYEDALKEYLSYFADSSELALLQAGHTTPELKTYGSRTVGVSVQQTITIEQQFATASEVMTSKDQILEYLKYGEYTEKQYYTVRAYDTVAGVGSKNNGLSATQVMNINRDKISSVDQVLSEGEELCVTYFNSPIDVVVTKESMKKEPIYPETVYVENAEMRQGTSEKTQDGINGSKNALYSEQWVNGVLMNGTVISSVETVQPVNEVIEVGTLVIPGYGTGTFRWPVDNPFISCRWGCYYGHRAIDIQNAYDKWGNLYAADRGVVELVSYNGINGNYMLINHNNGYHTYYGHMVAPSPLAVGTVVDKGDVIGSIGMTGLASGPHVHFFIYDDDMNRYDPCNGFLDCY